MSSSSEAMSVSFDYRPSEIHVFISEDGVLMTYLLDDVALCEMRRQLDETVEKTFLRLEKNLSKKGPKKSKVKAKTPVLASDAADGSSAILVEYNNETIDASLLLTGTYSLTYSLTHLLTHLPTHSRLEDGNECDVEPRYSLTHSPTYSLT